MPGVRLPSSSSSGIRDSAWTVVGNADHRRVAGERINEKDRCKECKGKKVIQESKILEVHVDKGMKHMQKIPFRGEGDQAVSGGESIARRGRPGGEWRRVHCVARATRRWVVESPLRGEGHQAVSGESIARRGWPGGEWRVHCAARVTRWWVESPLRGEGDQVVSGESIARRGVPGGEWRLESPLRGEGGQAVSGESIAQWGRPGGEWRVHCVVRATRRWVSAV